MIQWKVSLVEIKSMHYAGKLLDVTWSYIYTMQYNIYQFEYTLLDHLAEHEL